MISFPDDPTSPIGLAALGADGRALSEEHFAAKYGIAFLLHQGNLDPARKPVQPQATMIMGRGLLSGSDPPTAPSGEAPVRVRPDSAAAMDALRLYPVKHTGRSPFPRIVTVGADEEQ